MHHIIEELHTDITRLKLKVDGDGNGNKGLIRRMDAVDLKLNAIITLLLIVVTALAAEWVRFGTVQVAPQKHADTSKD